MVILDVPYGASLDDFYVLAWTSVKPLFPLVTDLVIGPVIGEVYFDSIFSDGYGPIGDRDPLRILREAVSQACSPINICVRGHPTSLADHQLRMDYLTGETGLTVTGSDMSNDRTPGVVTLPTLL